ncbi:MAG: hypothetical protein ABI873_10360 [Marmoricola sp.]
MNPETPVAWRGLRLDVIGGLRTLATLGPDEPERDPEFTAAVHALVDDTRWDHQDPRGYIGLVLVDEAEAGEAREVVAALVKVLDDLGPAADYDDYLRHPGWPRVTTTSAALLNRMVGQARES